MELKKRMQKAWRSILRKKRENQKNLSAFHRKIKEKLKPAQVNRGLIDIEGEPWIY